MSYKNKDVMTSMTCRVFKDDKDKFCSLFPYMISKFLTQCVRLAISDKDFFMSVMFGDVKK